MPTCCCAAYRAIPGIADPRIQQPASAPQFNVDVDRSRIGQYGLTERDVTNSLSTSLAGSSQTAPVFFVNPQNGVSYAVVAQAPEYLVQSLNQLGNLPISSTGGTTTEPLSGMATLERSATVPVMSHYNIQPVIDIYATTQGRDMGAVGGDIQAAIKSLAKAQPKGVTVVMRGQYETMNKRVLGAWAGAGCGDRAGLFADRGQFPKLGRSVRDHHRLAGGAGGDRLDAVHHRHAAIGAGADRGDHVHGGRHRQLDPGGQFRARTTGGDRRFRRGGARAPVTSVSGRC